MGGAVMGAASVVTVYFAGPLSRLLSPVGSRGGWKERERGESDGWFLFISSVECRALPLVLLHLFGLSNLFTLWSPLFGLILGDFCSRRCRCRSLRCVGVGNESSGSEGPMMTVADGVRGGRAEVAGLRQVRNRGAIVAVVASGYWWRFGLGFLSSSVTVAILPLVVRLCRFKELCES